MKIKINGHQLVFRILSIQLLLISLLLTSACKSPSKNEEMVYVFQDANVIDAVHGQQNNQNVVVRGNKIVQTGPATEVKAPPDAMVIDCSGKFLIPALWDAHVHLTGEDAMMPQFFPLLTANGILYVRDTGATLKSILPLREKAREVLAANGMAPRIFITGPHIDGLKLSWESSVSAGTVEQARARIHDLEEAEVNEIKVYDLIPHEVALEIFSIAKSRKFPIAAHIPLSMDVIEASDAGVTSMEHMYNLEVACSADWDSLLTSRRKMMDEGKQLSGNELRQSIYRAQRLHAFRTQDESRRETVLNTLAKNNTWQVPTLVIIAQEEHRMYMRDDWKNTYRFFPENIRNRWEKEALKKTGKTPSEEVIAHAEWAYDMVRRVNEKGIGIMAGTDMPLSFLTPGFSLHEELALLVKAGLTPLQALGSATLRPAQYFGIENQQGTIAEGMLADMILLDANPLENIRNSRQINAVMANGYLHTRDRLDEALLELENSMNRP